MNDTITVPKNQLERLENDIRSLKVMMRRVLALVERKGTNVKQVNVDDLDMSDPTPEEMMLYASHVFDVSSEPSPDDDNIANPENIKPIDWSGYAQTRQR